MPSCEPTSVILRSLAFAALIPLAASACGRSGEAADWPADTRPGVASPQGSAAPGAPSATTSIDSTHLPPAPAKFGGVMQPAIEQSKPWWPPQVRPPKGAPNVLLIMTDDVGFGAPSTFGGVIPTPALDRVAKTGLRYTAFHSTALCSPTRAALITGRNHHSVHTGVVVEQATGYPGYNTLIREGHRHHRRDPPAERLRHVVVRQGSQHAPLGGDAGRPLRPLADRTAASSTSTASSAATPASGSRTCSATPRRSSRTSASPAGT